MGMTNLDTWWSKLSKDDQELFLQHRNASPLPTEVANRAKAIDASTVVVHQAGQAGATVDWLGPTQQFLLAKAAGAGL
jgi:hypothetical protein